MDRAGRDDCEQFLIPDLSPSRVQEFCVDPLVANRRSMAADMRDFNVPLTDKPIAISHYSEYITHSRNHSHQDGNPATSNVEQADKCSNIRIQECGS